MKEKSEQICVLIETRQFNKIILNLIRLYLARNYFNYPVDSSKIGRYKQVSVTYLKPMIIKDML